MDYVDFINRRKQIGKNNGFEPVVMCDRLLPFQRSLVEWAVRKGRGAVLADCGLGKTICQLAWADNIRRHTGKRVLVLTPLAVGHQTCREAERFGFDAEISRDGKPTSAPITVTNYQKLHHFDTNDFGGVVCDESSILKNQDGATRHLVTEFLRTQRYRLLCTATAAPNDWHELGTQSEALGDLGFRDMITAFFKLEQKKGHHAYGRTKYRFKGHAKLHFWRWVCSWARACRRPSDLGFDDDGFVLPPLHIDEHVVSRVNVRDGFLFSVPAVTLEEQREERRATIAERTDYVASQINDSDEPAIVWCHLNDEGDALERAIPDAVQVSGSDSDDDKERKLQDFSDGNARVLVTKMSIGAWGLNWQHCARVLMYASHSYEQFYQAIRRCYRFGQRRPVNVDLITTDGEQAVMKNLQRKAAQADAMFSALVAEMNHATSINLDEGFDEQEQVPSWL